MSTAPVNAAATDATAVNAHTVRLLAVYTDADTAADAETPRQREHRTSRRALGFLLGTLGVSASPASLRFPHRRFSLSHTEHGSVALAALGPLPAALAGVGVDLEQDREVDHRAARFFLSEPERSWLAALPERRRHRDHVRLWTVKEALFKADPANADATLLGFQAVDPAARAGRAVKPGARTVFGYVSGLIRPGLHLSVAASFAPAAGGCEINGSEINACEIKTATASTAQAPIERGYGLMPTSAITFEAVAERISAMLNVPLEKITPETTLHDLAADSFRLVETVVDLQEEFDSMFTQAELKQVSTLGELVELLRKEDR